MARPRTEPADEAALTEAPAPDDPALLGAATVHERMLWILAALPAIGKGEWNEQQKFHYRSHDDVLNALNPLLARFGVFMVPRVLERVTDKRTTGGGKTMFEVNLHVQFTFYGARGDSIVASAWGEGTDMGDKSTNKAMTMAFKNVIAQAFAVSTQEGQQLDTDRGAPEATIDIRRRVMDGGPTTPEAVYQALQGIDPSINWTATLEPAIKHVFGVGTRQEIEPGAKTTEFWTRLANATVKMGDPSAFPTPGDHVVTDSIAWAFDGAVVTIVPNTPSEASGEETPFGPATDTDEDIPFGEPDASGAEQQLDTGPGTGAYRDES